MNFPFPFPNYKIETIFLGALFSSCPKLEPGRIKKFLTAQNSLMSQVSFPLPFPRPGRLPETLAVCHIVLPTLTIGLKSSSPGEG